MNGSTSDIIVFSYSQTTCLHIIDSVYSNEATLLPDFRLAIHSAIPYSKIDRINVTSSDSTIPLKDFLDSNLPMDGAIIMKRLILRVNKENGKKLPRYGTRRK